MSARAERKRVRARARRNMLSRGVLQREGRAARLGERNPRIDPPLERAGGRTGTGCPGLLPRQFSYENEARALNRLIWSRVTLEKSSAGRRESTLESIPFESLSESVVRV